MGGGGGRINKPKSARRKNKPRKQTKKRSPETASDTTEEMLRQCRTNPKANVSLSGKKKRLLLKEARRVVAEKAKMEAIDSRQDSSKTDPDRMDTTTTMQ